MALSSMLTIAHQILRAIESALPTRAETDGRPLGHASLMVAVAEIAKVRYPIVADRSGLHLVAS